MRAWAGLVALIGCFAFAAAKSGVSKIGLILDIDAPTEETITANAWRSVVSAQDTFQRDQLDLTALALRQALATPAFTLPSRFLDAFADASGLDAGFAGVDARTTITSGSAVYLSAPLVGTVDPDTKFLFHFSGASSGSAPTAPNDQKNEGTWAGTMAYVGGAVVQSSPASPVASGGFSGYTTATQKIAFSDAAVSLPVTSDFTWEFWHLSTTSSSSNGGYVRSAWLQTSNLGQGHILYRQRTDGNGNAVMQTSIGATGTSIQTSKYVTDGAWHHHALVWDATAKTFVYYIDGVREGTSASPTAGDLAATGGSFVFDGLQCGQSDHGGETATSSWDEMRLSSVRRYTGASFTKPTAPFSAVTYSQAATATAVSRAAASGTPRSVVSGVVLYSDYEGTAALGVDLTVRFSCDDGASWSDAAVLSDAGVFSSSGGVVVRMAAAGAVACPVTGTLLRHKVQWFNQASGSKITRVHGLGMNYV